MNTNSPNNSKTGNIVKLPELGEGVTEGELIRWLVKPGDTLSPDQSVAEIMTDKATVEVPTPIHGIVKTLKFSPGDRIPIDSVLLDLEESVTLSSPSTGKNARETTAAPVGGTLAAAAAAAAPVGGASAAAAAPPAPAPTQADPASIALSTIGPHILATPSTRKLAREMGVDLNQIKGTGLAGRVTREDVINTLPPERIFSSENKIELGRQTSPSPSHLSSLSPITVSGEVERIPLRGVRKKVAENMQASKRIIPHFTLMDEANVTELVHVRESLKNYSEKNKIKITFLPFVMKALVSSCKKFPMVNASIDDQAQEIIYKKYYNIGFAADTPQGLVVPVIKNADQKSLADISNEILDLSLRARENKLKLDEMKGATISVTNIGSIGGTYATPIINHPEVAILGMYKIQDKLSFLKENGQELEKIISQKVMNFTITADHRLIDGAVAAYFLKDFIAQIENPALLMLHL